MVHPASSQVSHRLLSLRFPTGRRLWVWSSRVSSRGVHIDHLMFNLLHTSNAPTDVLHSREPLLVSSTTRSVNKSYIPDQAKHPATYGVPEVLATEQAVEISGAISMFNAHRAPWFIHDIDTRRQTFTRKAWTWRCGESSYLCPVSPALPLTALLLLPSFIPGAVATVPLLWLDQRACMQHDVIDSVRLPHTAPFKVFQRSGDPSDDLSRRVIRYVLFTLRSQVGLSPLPYSEGRSPYSDKRVISLQPVPHECNSVCR